MIRFHSGRIILLFVLAILVLLYSSAISSTFVFGSNSSGLITLASTLENEYTANPFSKDATLISPSAAEWILLTFDWPYASSKDPSVMCGEWQSNIQSAIAARTLNSRKTEIDDRMIRLLNHFIDRGENVEERYCGYTALQSAVLFGDRDVVALLLGVGADPNALIVSPGKKSDGLNSFELAVLLANKDPKRMAGITESLGAAQIAN